MIAPPPIDAPVADEENENAIGRTDTLLQLGESTLDILFRRTTLDACGIPVRTLRQIFDILGRKFEPISRGVDHRHAPTVERVAVLLLPADPAHDQHVNIAANHRSLPCQKAGDRCEPQAHYTNPRFLRYTHSADTSRISMRKMAGMSQRSRRSTTVVPLSVNVISSGSVDTVFAV